MTSRRMKVKKKINKKIEEILDISYELCENSDSHIASQANLINNKTYGLKKDLQELKRGIYSVLYKISQNKKMDLPTLIKKFKDQGIDLSGD